MSSIVGMESEAYQRVKYHQNSYCFNLFICILFRISRIVESGVGFSTPHTL